MSSTGFAFCIIVFGVFLMDIIIFDVDEHMDTDI